MSKQLIDDVLDYFISHDSQMLANVNGNNSIETRGEAFKRGKRTVCYQGNKRAIAKSDD